MQKTDTRSLAAEWRRGLSEEAAELSRRKYGTNSLRTRKSRGFISRFLKNLGDPVIKVLLGALAANIIFTIGHTDWIETLGIALSVITATTVSTISEYGGEAAFKRLAAEAGHGCCRVRRAGQVRELPISDIVVGDVVLLGAGEAIPADGYIISGQIGVDQSAMTGETREAEKTALRRLPNAGISTDRHTYSGEMYDAIGECAKRGSPLPSDPCGALRGCLVISGEAEMLVSAVGDLTSLGGISGELQEETRESPLKLRLSHLASQISRLGYAAAAIVAAAFLFNAFVIDSGYIGSIIIMKLRDASYLIEKLLSALTLGLTVVVVAVPEGLPMMIAVVLSANIRRMVNKGVLVRKPVGIEAAGSMNILFTDKTGTLTEGHMTVGDVILGNGRRLASPDELRQISGALWREYRTSAYLNTASAPGSDYTLGEKKRSNGKCSMVPIGGNAADRAIMASVLELELSNADIIADLPICLRRLPFDSKRKYSACRCSADGGKIYIKGAPEVLLPRACGYIDEHGYACRADLRRFASAISAARRGGGRILLIATGTGSYGGDMIPRELYIIAAVELRDRLRPTAEDTVGELRRAGIKVVMITGDSAETAEVIARSCGILGRGIDKVISSDELAEMSDDDVGAILPRLGVVARAVPSDKSRLVRIAQKLGLVVGMTGDGINDAPALRRADIGFAMGSGTDVARDASDIVLLRDDLSSVASAVLYGRNIFKSIRKFITLQLTMNLCAVGVSMIGPFVGIDAPVTVVQMLWINIIMDTLGGLAFAGEGALPSCMREPPKRRDEPILNRYMINQIAVLGIFTVALSLAFLKLPFFTCRFRYAADDKYLLTAFFAFFIFAGVFNCFNARTDRLNILANIKKNPAFIGIMSAVLIIQIAFVYLGGEVLRTVPLTAAELACAMLSSLAVFPIELVRKLFWRLRKNGGGY